MQPCARIAAALRVIIAVAVSFVVLTAAVGVDRALGTHTNSTIALGAVDPNSADNTATSLGPRETCLQIEPGATVDVDVTVAAIPTDRPMTAYQVQLFYNPAIVNVTASDFALLLAANEGSKPLPALTDPLPDSDGSFQVAALDFSTSPGETGPGVLTRVTLTAVGSGVSNLSPANFNIRDDRNEQVPVDSLAAAYLSVGQQCPTDEPPVLSEPPRATSTPEPGTVPSTTPGYTSGPGESPGTQPTPVLGVTPTSAVSSGSSNDEDDGVPTWIFLPIVFAVMALAGAGYAGLRWWRGRRA